MAKSKKVRKHRQAEITLEPDGFSIHTFELSMKLSKSEWNGRNANRGCLQIRSKPASIGSIRINRAVIISAHDMQTQALEFD